MVWRPRDSEEAQGGIGGSLGCVQLILVAGCGTGQNLAPSVLCTLPAWLPLLAPGSIISHFQAVLSKQPFAVCICVFVQYAYLLGTNTVYEYMLHFSILCYIF